MKLSAVLLSAGIVVLCAALAAWLFVFQFK
jgi:hypothetical protein